MVEPERIEVLNDAPVRDGRFVLYWMQSSQRGAFNPALEFAIGQANALDRPCLAVFGLTEQYPEARDCHYAFMLEGLAAVARELAARDIKLVLRRGEPWRVAAGLARDACIVVCDVGYLRLQRDGRARLAATLDRRVVAVEGDVVVPLRSVSDKAEYAARTIRPRIQRRLNDFLHELRPQRPRRSSIYMPPAVELDPRDPARVLAGLDVPRSPGTTGRFHGGTAQARRRLTRFIRATLAGYADARNDPADPTVSRLSPYLHFGQISPVEIALKIRRAGTGSAADKAAFLEELIVRRELAANFVFYTPDYDRYSCLPEWARRSLAEHRDDERPHRYTRSELESARTHDVYWNAAMLEARHTGYMHNYMRMYWGKKIIEWTNTPEYAFETALYLNNKYFLDGRDANSYANVAWLFGLHDRPWTERPVFGKVRYMNAAGLERKFDIDAYVERVAALAAGAG